MTIDLRTIKPSDIMKVRAEQSADYRKKYGNSTIVLFHQGGCYLGYGQNADDLSKATGLTVQFRNGRQFAEFPEKSSDIYFPRCVREGFKIAIIEVQ